MRDRLMVGRRTLDPLILVRFQVPQHSWSVLSNQSIMSFASGGYIQLDI